MIDAPREKVFAAWTDPEQFKQWWGPNHFTTPVSDIDLRVGGKYRACMRGPDGREYWSGGEYREINEPSLLVMSDHFIDEEGNRVPPSHYGLSADFPAEALIKVTFDDIDGKTRVTMEQSIPISIAESSGAPEGWNQSFDKLVKYLERRK
jgi:uncharacterized protein YndB with AHSA1/START domain